MKKVLLSISLPLYFIVLASLLLSTLAAYISPQTVWILAFFGLAYPYLLAVNIFFLIAWAVAKKKWFWVSVVCILAGCTNIHHMIAFGCDEENKNEGIKVLTYNVRNFDLYNWTHNKETRNNIFNFLEKESPDILCIQEFFQGDSSYFETLDTLTKLTHSVSQHVRYTLTRYKIHHWGIATFSKYPIVRRGLVPYKYRSNNICIFSDIKINDDTVRVYNMHLQSIHFGYADYKFVDALKEKNDTLDSEDVEIASKNILRRLKRAFIKRTTQAEKIIAHIDSCKYPVIICGDFNDTPFSYTYRSFTKKYKDSFIESGCGLGNTYLGTMPSNRIDYILHSANIKASEFNVHPEELSDHAALSCRIKIIR